MFDLIKKLLDEGLTKIRNAANLQDTNNLRIELLGKAGAVTALMARFKDVPKEQKPEFGKRVNEAKTAIEAAIQAKIAEFKEKEMADRLSEERIDVSINYLDDKMGSLHPTTIVMNEILDTFIGMGFTVSEGPEIETDYYNFQALNVPRDHPARDMQDTFFINENLLLRTQTSAMQIRVMENQRPPIRVVNPGKVYRSDDDATHSPMFQQIEGLVVDEHITLCDLKGALEIFAKRTFDESTKVRFRPSYFPFTEPSVEVDVSCAMCHGAGCRLCKGTGWIEILGAGIVNPVVLDNCGIDSKRYSGFAFGFGVERIAMIKYGIPDMRILFENDTRFLRQFVKRG